MTSSGRNFRPFLIVAAVGPPRRTRSIATRARMASSAWSRSRRVRKDQCFQALNDDEEHVDTGIRVRFAESSVRRLELAALNLASLRTRPAVNRGQRCGFASRWHGAGSLIVSLAKPADVVGIVCCHSCLLRARGMRSGRCRSKPVDYSSRFDARGWLVQSCKKGFAASPRTVRLQDWRTAFGDHHHSPFLKRVFIFYFFNLQSYLFAQRCFTMSMRINMFETD